RALRPAADRHRDLLQIISPRGAGAAHPARVALRDRAGADGAGAEGRLAADGAADRLPPPPEVRRQEDLLARRLQRGRDAGHPALVEVAGATSAFLIRSSIFGRGCAPTIWPSTLPSLNRSSVGIERTSYCDGTFGLLSTSSLPILTLPA